MLTMTNSSSLAPLHLCIHHYKQPSARCNTSSKNIFMAAQHCFSLFNVTQSRHGLQLIGTSSPGCSLLHRYIVAYESFCSLVEILSPVSYW